MKNRTEDVRRARLALSALLCLSCLATAASPAAPSSKDTDWAVTSGDFASRRYAPLSQIDRENVGRLEVAWRWTSPDMALIENNSDLASRRMGLGSHEGTPLKIGDRLYITTGYSQLVAIDASRGETLWTFDPESYSHGRPPNLGFVHRGATWWTDADAKEGGERLFYASGAAFLHAVDPHTGEPIGSFGEGGSVSLTASLRREVAQRSYGVTSPVVVCRDVIVVGSSIADGAAQREGPPGDVRGFDARSGELRWTFHSVPQEGEFGNDTWGDESWRVAGNTNVWTLMSADEELGMVYLPFGTPTNDYYGGHRPGDNLFAESLVALDCESGERRWHFQTTHHGVWDYDLVTSPVLADITVDGTKVKAAAQLSKQGFVYVFDRVSGEPVWPIEERPVPQSKVAGERTSPTQPFPTKPPPFEPQGMSEDLLIDFTPALREEAKAILANYDYGPLFTPPTERGVLAVPGWAGGASWQGGAFDPETEMLYVPSFTHPVVIALRKPDPSRSDLEYVGAVNPGITGPDGLPLVKPPYARLTAYHLGKGEIAWVKPLGEGPRDHPRLRDLDLPPLGDLVRSHVLVTDTLLFVSSGAGLYGPEYETPDPETGELPSGTLRAFDKATGELVWEHDLGNHTDGSPITYLHEGRQYLVVALGGGSRPAELLALRLPE